MEWWLRRRFIPVSESYDGDKFFTLRDSVKMATPLLLALAVVELSDVAFAVDSIPAVCILGSFLLALRELFSRGLLHKEFALR